jgi:hypothetical protein
MPIGIGTRDVITVRTFITLGEGQRTSELADKVSEHNSIPW